MEYLAFIYPDEFGIDEPSHPISQLSESNPMKKAKKDPSTYANRYKLDILVDTPTVFIPINEISKGGLQAELGTVSTFFTQKFLTIIKSWHTVFTKDVINASKIVKKYCFRNFSFYRYLTPKFYDCSKKRTVSPSKWAIY